MCVIILELSVSGERYRPVLCPSKALPQWGRQGSVIKGNCRGRRYLGKFSWRGVLRGEPGWMRRRRLCEMHSVGWGVGGAVAIPEGRNRKCTGFRGSRKEATVMGRMSGPRFGQASGARS